MAYDDIAMLPTWQRQANEEAAELRRSRKHRKIAFYFLIGGLLLFVLELQIESLLPWKWFSDAVVLTVIGLMVLFIRFVRKAKDSKETLKYSQGIVDIIEGKLRQERKKDQGRVDACEEILEYYRPELEEINYNTALLTSLIAGGITASALEEKTKRVLEHANALVLGEREQESSD